MQWMTLSQLNILVMIFILIWAIVTGVTLDTSNQRLLELKSRIAQLENLVEKLQTELNRLMKSEKYEND